MSLLVAKYKSPLYILRLVINVDCSDSFDYSTAGEVNKYLELLYR